MARAAPTQGAVVEGFAEPFQEIEVAAGAETGLIAEILVHEGDRVRQGQVVAKLDTSVLDASLEISRRRAEFDGRLKAAVAEQKMRSRRLEKLRELQRRGHASPAELDRAEADLAVADAQVTLANEDRELARLECDRIQAQIEQRRLRSPIEGIVVEVFHEVGESIVFSDPRMMMLVQLHPLRVKFPVSVKQSQQFAVDQKVNIELPEFKSTVQGRVQLVAPVLDAKSGTVQITCLIDNREGRFRSGMRCLLTVSGDDAPRQDKEQQAITEFEDEF
jgi:RND family efflux transporter MFP subunit